MYMGNISPFPHGNNARGARGHIRKNAQQLDKTTKLLGDTMGDTRSNTQSDSLGDPIGDPANPIPSYHAEADKHYNSMRSNRVADKKTSGGWK